ncbi:MAG: nucleotide exchange factor GrpE [Euryarchaeota archaeon]|nr:nucleotide exchange factor GrpE [Euryarchaeota archaeon]|tara:strand:- start:2239 stop:2772 length:534 start_codon:yes stop_codon:yes gene_type:complete
MTDEEISNEDEIEVEETSEEIVEKELTLEEKYEQLENKLAKAEAEIGYRDAEIINVRKKMSGEKSALIRYAGLNLSRRILSVLDDVDRALMMIDEENNSPEAEGLRLIRTKLWQQLTLDGISHIDALNSDFDPNLHEAITTVPPTDEFPSGKIVEVLEEGYMYKDKLLKASKVVVSS